MKVYVKTDKKLGTLLRAPRKRKKWTQVYLARQLGIGQTSMSKVEQGQALYLPFNRLERVFHS